MGLPEVIISFSSAAQTAIVRSQQGVVALVLRDDTIPTTATAWVASTAYTVGEYVAPTSGVSGWIYQCTTAGSSSVAEPTWPTTSGTTVSDGTVTWTAVQITTTNTYNVITDVATTDWTAANYDLISKTFLGTPYQVIVVRGNTTDADYTAQLTTLASMRWDWLAIPGIDSTDATTVSTWLIAQRAAEQIFKAVLPNTAADNEGVVNFTTDGIVVGATTYTTSEYTARIAGILAGLPLTQSATYYVLTEVDSITQSTTPGTDIDAGDLILINDGVKIKIARGVNSLQTITSPKSADWQKIKIIEGHDIVQSDVINTFNDEYVGKVNNDYDNQAIFIAAVNSYLDQLGGTVLDPDVISSVGVNVAAQRAAWQSAGTDTTTWTDAQVKKTAFQSKVFLSGSMKFLDAMEDLQFDISV